MTQGKLVAYQGKTPQLAEEVYLADGGIVIGDVIIGRGSSIWFNTVIRGDDHSIAIGSYTNIQDGSVIHAQPEDYPVVIGDYVTVGHRAIIHGCSIGDNCLIGMGAVIMNGVQIGDNCLIGAGALIAENKTIPANSMVVGSPGRVLRSVSPEEARIIRQSALHYYGLSLNYKTANQQMGGKQMEKTLVLVKPDGVSKGLTGEILTRLERRGLKVCALKMVRLSRSQGETHYGEHRGKPFFDNLVDFITSGPLVAMVVQGENSVRVVRMMMGPTNPADAAPGTIRGDYALNIGCNVIHGSDSPESAAREIAHFFTAGEIFE